MANATKEMISTAAAAQAKSQRGMGRSVLPLMPWADATSGATAQARTTTAALTRAQDGTRPDRDDVTPQSVPERHRGGPCGPPERLRRIYREGLEELNLRPFGRTLVKPNLVAAGEMFPHAFTRPECGEAMLKAGCKAAGTGP